MVGAGGVCSRDWRFFVAAVVLSFQVSGSEFQVPGYREQ
jgi:hypothetical protein